MAYYVEYDSRGKEVRVPKRGRPRSGWVEVSPGRWEKPQDNPPNQKRLASPDEVKDRLAELQKVLHPLRIERDQDKKIMSFIGCDIVGASKEISSHFCGQTSFSRIDVDLVTGVVRAWKVVGKGKPDLVIRGLLVSP